MAKTVEPIYVSLKTLEKKKAPVAKKSIVSDDRLQLVSSAVIGLTKDVPKVDSKQADEVIEPIVAKPIKKVSDSNSTTSTKEISNKTEVAAIQNTKPKNDLSEVKPIVPKVEESNSKEDPPSLWSIVKNIFKQE